MNTATKLDETIAAIVNGGFMDDLGDESIKRMARELDSQVTVKEWSECGEEWFATVFADGSELTFHKFD